MDKDGDKRKAVDSLLKPKKVPRSSLSSDQQDEMTPGPARPITCDSEYVINGQERWGIARSPKVRPSKPNELSALSERIIGFHTHSFAFAAACAWIEQDTAIFGPDVVAKLSYEIFIPGRI